MIYIIILLLLLYLSYLYDIRGYRPYKREMFLFVKILLILVAGLRYRIGGDTTNYINLFYHVYPVLEDFSFEDYPIGKDPLYVIINSLVKTLGGRFYVVQLIQSIFVITLTFIYFKKHSRYYFTCVLFYFVTYYYFYYTMEIMRAGMSIVLCLYANDFILEKKWLKSFFLIFVAVLFHAQSAVMLIIPILYFLKFNRKGVAFLIFGFFVGKYIQAHLLDYIQLISLDDTLQSKADYYANDEGYSKTGGNINFLIVKIFPTMFYTLWCLYVSKKNKWSLGIIKLQPFVMTGLFFLVLQVNVQIAYRFVDYFYIYFLFYFSEVFVEYSYGSKLMLKKSISYARSVFLFAPFFFMTSFDLYKTNSFRFFPYNSVLNRQIDKERDSGLMKHGFPRARIEEY